MTAHEARKVIRILLTADGGCSCCAEKLLERFAEIWPQHKADCEKLFDREYGRQSGRLTSWGEIDKAPGLSVKETRTTTDGMPPVIGFENASAPAPIDPVTGQHGAYWVLSEEERKKGWVRPLRRKYKHKKCGVVTSMGLALCETYAKNPAFYSHTFCIGCSDHLPVSEFIWDEDGMEVGS